MAAKKQSRAEKGMLDLRASQELIGLNPATAGRPATESLKRSKIIPAQAVPVQLPGSVREPIRLIREPFQWSAADEELAKSVETAVPAFDEPPEALLATQKTADKPASEKTWQEASSAEVTKAEAKKSEAASAESAEAQPTPPSCFLPKADEDAKVERPIAKAETPAPARAPRHPNDAPIGVNAPAPKIRANKAPNWEQAFTRDEAPRRRIPSAEWAASFLKSIGHGKGYSKREKARRKAKKPGMIKRLTETLAELQFDPRVSAVAFTVLIIVGVIAANRSQWRLGVPNTVSAATGAQGAGAELNVPLPDPGAFQEPATLTGKFLRTLARRAATYVVDQFDGGLGDWSDIRSLNLTAGGLRVGPGLALRKSTMELEDYRFEFEAKTEAGGVGWVVRAADVFDYYAFKFDASKRLQRFAVIDGQPQQAITIDPPAGLIDASGFNRFLVQVKGGRITTVINGLGIDAWRDNRIDRGGVGFRASSGDSAVVRRMMVVANDDVLGRVLNGAIYTIKSFQEPGSQADAGWDVEAPVAVLVIGPVRPGLGPTVIGWTPLRPAG